MLRGEARGAMSVQTARGEAASIRKKQTNAGVEEKVVQTLH